MRKINWEAIGDFAGRIGESALYAIMLAGAWKVGDHITKIPDDKPVGYDDAVSAIMKSDMYSHDKCMAAAALKRVGSAEFYRAIIHVVNDPETYSYDKVEAIKHLSE